MFLAIFAAIELVITECVATKEIYFYTKFRAIIRSVVMVIHHQEDKNMEKVGKVGGNWILLTLLVLVSSQVRNEPRLTAIVGSGFRRSNGRACIRVQRYVVRLFDDSSSDVALPS
jgi:hypothetical protein